MRLLNIVEYGMTVVIIYETKVTRIIMEIPYRGTKINLRGSDNKQNKQTQNIWERTSPTPFKNIAKAPPVASNTIQTAKNIISADGIWIAPFVQ